MGTGRLMAAAEIARRLGVGRSRVKAYLSRPDWPAPYDELEIARIWLTADVERWIAEHRPDLNEQPEHE